MQRGDRVLLDTMVIIEAHRAGCWNALRNAFRLETVERCVVECATGNRMRRNYYPLDDAQLRADLVVHPVDAPMLTNLITREPFAASIDDGERELIAFAITQAPIPLLSTCDNAAIRTMHKLALIDQVVSLEEGAMIAGFRSATYANDYTKKRMAEWRLQITMGIV